MKILHLFTAFLLACLLAGCGREEPSLIHASGDEKSLKSKVLEIGAAALQGKPPLENIHMYVCGFHFYNGEMNRQVEAHHYCMQVNEDVHQCIIFDSHAENAKLIGIEYIISERLFVTLPEEEKRLWHSHHHEVKSGTLIAPGLPETAEHELMEKLVGTYGKTFHTWQVDRGDTLPLGIPQLMMAFTKDGQIQPDLLADRDRRFEVSAQEERANREDIPLPTVRPGANAWEQGDTVQLELAARSGPPAPAPSEAP